MEKQVKVDTQGFFVKCRQFRPTPLVSLEDCKACEHFKGIQDSGAKWPSGESIEQVRCSLPTLVDTWLHVHPLKEGDG